MRLVPPSSQGGGTCGKIKTDVKFENPKNDTRLKFCPGIEKNDEEMQEPIQDEVNAPHKEMKNPYGAFSRAPHGMCLLQCLKKTKTSCTIWSLPKLTKGKRLPLEDYNH